MWLDGVAPSQPRVMFTSPRANHALVRIVAYLHRYQHHVLHSRNAIKCKESIFTPIFHTVAAPFGVVPSILIKIEAIAFSLLNALMCFTTQNLAGCSMIDSWKSIQMFGLYLSCYLNYQELAIPGCWLFNSRGRYRSSHRSGSCYRNRLSRQIKFVWLSIPVI